VSAALLPVERDRLAELERVVEQGLQTFVDVGHALAEIRDARLYRATHATFEDYLRSRWDMSRPQGYRLIEAAEVVDLVSPIGDIAPPANEAQARELVPLLDDERAVVDVWRDLRAEYGDDITAERVRRLVQPRLERVRRERDAAERPTLPTAALPPGVDVRRCDLRELDVPEGSVAAIVTDPPYPAEYLDEWDALGELAARTLAPDGVLVAMAGQTHLPAYLARLAAHLDYRWCVAYLTDGPATRVHGRGVGTKWKPILVFDRAGDRRFLTQDVVASTTLDKEHHHWGQSESGIAALVERFTRPGELVVDPFLGGGTTAVVCRDLGRRFVGCDVDARAIEAAERRL
jgi:SAM-dependent methyltransferase